MAKTGKQDVATVILERLKTKVESGDVLPWIKPWKTYHPCNLMTYLAQHKPDNDPSHDLRKHGYNGINVFTLATLGYSSPFFLTFKQAKELGGSVRMGERGFPVVFWKIHVKESDELDSSGDKVVKTFAVLRYFTVFNTEQCDGIQVPELPAFEVSDKQNTVVESLLYGDHLAPHKNQNGDKAAYNPLTDKITMPDAAQFGSHAWYYWTLAHEKAHSTGHVSRLGRPEIMNPAFFGTKPYSREELCACMTQALFCAEFGLYDDNMLNNDASYLHGWLQALDNDPKMLIKAASEAQKALDYICKRTDTETDDSEG